jgi:polygalacturonase
VVDGQGYWWWMREYLLLNKGKRPHLLQMVRVQNGYFTGVKWQNSPSYHLLLNDVDTFVLENFEVYVDVYEQRKL